MIPIGDSIPGERFPLVRLSPHRAELRHLLLKSRSADAEAFIRHWGLVPSDFVHHITSPHAWLTIFTAMYLHGGWEHIVGNMLYLWNLRATTSRHPNWGTRWANFRSFYTA